MKPRYTALAAWLRAHPLDLLGVCCALLYALPSAWYPFGSDQGIHWYIGDRLLHGDLPYVHGGISGKPPGIFVVYAFAIALLGHSMAAIRCLDMAALPLFGWLITKCARLTQPARDGELGTATLLVSAATFTYHGYWNTAHPETWLALSLIGALSVALHEQRPARRALLVGSLSGIAFVLKYTAAGIALPIAGVCGLRALVGAPAGRRTRALFAEAALFLAGVALVCALCVLPYALSGTLRQMREVCWDMTVKYAHERLHKPFWPALWSKHGQGSLFLFASGAWLLGMLVAAARRAGAELLRGALLFVLVASAIWSVAVQGRLFSYHWLAVYPFLALAIVWALRQLTFERGAAQLAIALAFSVAAFVSEPSLSTDYPRTYKEHYAHWFALVAGKTTHEAFMRRYAHTGVAERYDDMLTIAQLVRAHARPRDTLCMRRFTSPLYELTGLHCNSRHAIGMFVAWGPRNWPIEYGRDLLRRPPTFFVTLTTVRGDASGFLRRGYVELGRAGRLILLMRRR